MGIEQKKYQDFDSTNLIVFLLRWRKPLIIVCILAAVVSSVVSLLIKEKYLSTVIFFPASTSSISKSVMTQDLGGRNDIVAFGEEEQAEQMLQILNSDEIREAIVNKYNLMEHYDIKSDEEYRYTKLMREWESNVSFKRTEFLSIRVDVLDHSPDTAALIANDIARLVDEVKNRMQQERAQEALKVIKEQYDKMMQHMQEIDDSLRLLASKGVLEYEKQIEMLSNEYYKSLAKGDMNSVRRLKEKMDTLAKYGATYVALSDNGEFERERMILLRSKYEETLVDATKDIPHKFVVNRAQKSEKKAYPVRWLIVVLSTLSAFVLAVIVIIGIENYRRLQQPT